MHIVSFTDMASYPAFHCVKVEDHPSNDITKTLHCIAAQIRIYHNIPIIGINKFQNIFFDVACYK